MSTNLDKIRTTAFEQLRSTIGELSSGELRALCVEMKISGLSRGSKKACAKAVFDAEVAHRKAHGDGSMAPVPDAGGKASPPPSDPEVAAQVAAQVDAGPKKGGGKTRKSKAPSKRKTAKKSAKKAASKKAPKAKRSKAKAPKTPKEPPPPEPRVKLPVGDIAESSYEAIEDLMHARDIDFATALDILVKVGRSRLRATDKYYRSQVDKKAAK